MLRQRLIKTIVPLVFLYLPISAAAQSKISPNEIVKRADRARFPEGDISFEVSVDDFSKGKQVATTLYRVQARGVEASLVETLEPVRLQGQKLLMLTDNLWMMTPNIRRPVRVSLQQRLTGQVANGDIARTDYAGDYEAELLGEERIGKRQAYKLNLKAKSKDVTYTGIRYWVDKKDFLPLRSEFLAASGKLMKVGVFGNFKLAEGRIRPNQMVIEDSIDKSTKSVMNYAKMKKDKFSDSLFNKETL